MRDYAKVDPRFWTGDTGKRIRAAGPQSQVVAFYLLTCPSSNMIGLYYLPLPTLCHEVGCTPERAREALEALSQGDFAYYDEGSEYVWVPRMAAFQIEAGLKPGDNRIVGIRKLVGQLKHGPFVDQFLERYAAAFHLVEQEAPSKPLASPSEARSRKKSRSRIPPKPPCSDKEETRKRFDEFWTGFPARDGKKLGKTKAYEFFAALSDAEQQACIAAAREYAKHCRLTDRIPKDPHRFIKGKDGEFWRDCVPAERKQSLPAAVLNRTERKGPGSGEPMPPEVREKFRSFGIGTGEA